MSDEAQFRQTLKKGKDSLKVFGVYTHARPDGDIFYVGKGTIKRALCTDRPRNPWHQNIVKKYGSEKIFVAFYPSLSEASALQEEIKLIKKLRQEGYDLVNQTKGGDGTSGYKFTKYQTQKISRAASKAMKELWKDPVYRAKMVESQKKWLCSSERIEKLKQYLKDPDVKAAKTRALVEGNKRSWNDPYKKAKRLHSIKEAFKKPECKRKRSASMRLKWQDPAYREKVEFYIKQGLRSNKKLVRRENARDTQ